MKFHRLETVTATVVALLQLVNFVGGSTFNILNFEDNPTKDVTTFQQVEVDPTTGNVFVAGTNVFYKLDEHMNVLDFVQTGPVQDNPPCDDPNCVGNLVDTDNEAKVLEVDPTSGSLLFCGSTLGGICSMHPMLNLKGYQQLNTSNPLNFIGGKADVFAFYGNGGSLENSIPTLYSANTYDGRAIGGHAHQDAIAARRLVKKNGNFNFDYLFHSPERDVYTAIDLDFAHKKDYIIKYIYGFEHKGFTYFLTVQREYTYSLATKYTTKLARVCQNDIGFYSYTELELVCRKKNGIAMFYNVALAAYFAPIGQELTNKFQISDSEYALYIAFGKQDGSSSDPDPEKGTGICMFAMNSIRKEFTKAQMNCYSGRGELLPWIIEHSVKCTANAPIAASMNDSFCGSRTNVGIGSLYPLSTETNVTSEHVVATSLGVVVHGGKTVAIIGTSTGYILKVLIDGTDSPPYAAIKVASDGGNRSIARDMAFDRDKKHVYALTKDKISKVPVQSCRVYNECSECVTTRDPLECGWCENYCSTKDECKSGSFSKDACPPVLHSFHPKSGPLQGGTKVTIQGKNFGNATSSTASVKVSLVPCTIESRNATRITCRTGKSQLEIVREVEVTVVDTSRTIVPYNIQGDAESGHESFSYKEPRVDGFTPLMGPQSGGTRLTIQGANLDIGSSLVITAAYLPCFPISVKSEAVVCNTSKYSEESKMMFMAQRMKRSISEGPVNVTLDNARMNGHDKHFSYENDPTISDVLPTTSILSGGFNITVRGENLHVIHKPQIEMVVVGDENAYVDNCEAEEGGEIMICKSPNLSTINQTVSVERHLMVDMRLQMDGVQKLYNLPTEQPILSRFKYTVDPTVYPFSGYNNVKTMYKDEVFLNILGENLDLAATEGDVIVEIGGKSCNVTQLGTTVIVCMPDKPVLPQGVPQAAVVHIGYREYKVGFVEYANRRTEVIAAIIIAPILVFIGLVVFILAICYMRRNRRGPFKKKAGGGEVRYHRGDQVDISGTSGEQIYRLNNHVEQNQKLSASTQTLTDLSLDGDVNENAYWTHSQLHMNQMTNQVRHRPNMATPWRVQDSVLDEEARRLIEDSQLFIPRERLLLLDIIGQGHFGCVYKGFMKLDEGKEEIEVAVKTLKSLTETNYTNNSADARKFLEEALRMREFDHPHILRLIGICMDKEDLPLVVLPYMKHGDLLSYIRNERNNPTVKSLMDFGIQIAEGMAYLASLKFVHRDLAARNCMLDDSMNVKVADFGLSRDIYERDYYSSDDRKAKLPVKWMALESLEKGIYNTKTDVWSYGVVLWELMTRGVCPYPEVDNWDIIKFLKSGRRMPQPSYCPDALYRIMLYCWEPDPKCRPIFEELVQAVRQVIITLEKAHQQVGLDITYVNVPATQSYLYPRSSSSEEPSPVVQNMNNNNSHYHQQEVVQTSLPVHSGTDTMRSVTGSRSTMV